MVKHGLPQIILKYKGVYDFDDIYRKIIVWLEKEEFEFHEKLYKNKPPELEIKWVAKKKVTAYVMYEIDFYFYFRGVKEFEMAKEGVKKKMMQARLELYLDSAIITGYPDELTGRTSQWQESAFLVKLQDFYDKFVVKKDLEFKHEGVLYYLVYRLHNYIKELFDMQAKGNAY